jgi:nucleoside-diphosphate-sugar epimerase
MVVMFQPAQVRAYAKFHLQRAKNDRIDAALIATCTAAVRKIHPAPDPRLQPFAEQLTMIDQIGEELVLPNLGMEMLHHVHADDIARWIIPAIEHRAQSVGEVFNTVSEQAVTLRGYAETVYRWFGKEARLSFKPFDAWINDLGEWADSTRGHIIRSSCHSIEKSHQRLGYKPRYTSFGAIHEAVDALIAQGRVVGPQVRAHR